MESLNAGIAPLTRLAFTAACACLIALVLTSTAAAQTVFFGNSNTIVGRTVGATGGLTPTGASAASPAGIPRAINITPNGSLLTQANYDPVNSIASWSLSPGNDMALAAGSPLATLLSPAHSAISPDGRFLYISSGYNDAGIRAYSIGAGGALTAIDNDFVDGNGGSISITPNGRYLYVCATSGLWDFSIAADGTLGELGDAGKVPGASGCLGSSIAPDGQTLVRGEYVGATTDLDQIRSARIGVDGSISSLDTEIVGYRPDEIVFGPNGRFVVSIDIGAGGATNPSVTSTAMDPDGTLIHRTTHSVTAPGSFLAGGSISPDGKFVYATLKTSGNNIYGFAPTEDGYLGSITGSPFASGGTIPSSSLQSVGFKPAQGPVAKLSTSGSGATRSFSAADSTDSDSAIGSYSWNFGDGETATTSTVTTSHTFAKPGVFDVTVRAVATDNCQTELIYTGRTTLCNPGSTASVKVDAQPPVISKLKLTRTKFKVNKKAKAPKVAKAKKVAKGTVVTYGLSKAGTLKFQVEKPAKGRTVGKNCVKPTKSNKKRKSCTRYVATGKSWTLTAAAGSRKTPFSGKVGSKSLKAGKYRLSIVASDVLKNVAAPRIVKFTILR